MHSDMAAVAWLHRVLFDELQWIPYIHMRWFGPAMIRCNKDVLAAQINVVHLRSTEMWGTKMVSNANGRFKENIFGYVFFL